jgi:hypothetical protein
VICFHLESMGEMHNEASLVTSVPQKSIICLRAQKLVTDRCIAKLLSAPKGQRMLEEKNKRRSVESRKSSPVMVGFCHSLNKI